MCQQRNVSNITLKYHYQDFNMLTLFFVISHMYFRKKVFSQLFLNVCQGQVFMDALQLRGCHKFQSLKSFKFQRIHDWIHQLLVNNNNFTNFKEFHDCPSPIVELALGTHHASTRMQSSDLGHA